MTSDDLPGKKPGPTRIYSDTKADMEDVAELGYMPTKEEIDRQKRFDYNDCRLVATAILPARRGAIDVFAQPKREGDTEDTLIMRTRGGGVEFGSLAARNMVHVLNFIRAYFELNIDDATRRENEGAKLEIDPTQEDDPKIIINDYINARVSVNRRSKTRLRENDRINAYKRSSKQGRQGLKEAFEKQGLEIEDHKQGHD